MTFRHVHTKSAFAMALALLMTATPAFAAGGGHGHGFPWVDWAVNMLNFVVFFGALAYFAGPKLNTYFADRRETLLADLNESKRLREEAEQKFDEYSKKLDALEEERKALMDEYHREGEAEKEKMVAEAKETVEKMRADAELVIQQEVRKAVAAIEAQAVDLALDMAQKRLGEKIDDTAQNKLFADYVKSLNEANA